MDQADLFFRFGVATAIGFLIGVQREFAHGGKGSDIFAGERTLALMGLLGCASAYMTDILQSPWIMIAVVLLVGLFIGVGYFVSAWRGEMGLTTEITAIIVIIIGALVYWGHLILSIAIGAATFVLLSIKIETDTFIRRLTREDFYAT